MATAANTTYATNLYTTLLLRNGNAAEINGWATLLDSGAMSQAQLVTTFENSPEAIGSVDPIVRLFATTLHRAPDASGFKYWENVLATTTPGTAAYTATLNSIAANFVASAEFTAVNGTSPSVTTFINTIYNNALGRVPDAGGLAYWTGQLSTNNATTEGAVAAAITNSAEFINNSTAAINTWLSAANTAAQAGSLSPYPSTDPGVGSPPSSVAPLSMTFTLTTATDSFAGAAGNDTFSGTFSNGGTNTFSGADTIIGNGGTNTLNIDPTTANTAITLDDSFWAHVSGIQNITLSTTGSGTQSFTTGGSFNAAFATGVNLTMTTTSGDINVAMGTDMAPLALVTTSTSGAQTITTGSGLANVTASSGVGQLTIVGANLSTVTATTTGAATQTITSTGAGAVTITASDVSGTQTVTTGNGSSTINLSGSGAASVQHVTVGSGINAVTFTAGHTGVDTLAFSAANGVSTTSFTTVTNAHISDTITFATAALNNTVTNQTTAVASVAAGIAASTSTSGYNTFHDAANTYIYENTGTAATSELVSIVGTAHTVTGLGGVATIMA